MLRCVISFLVLAVTVAQEDELCYPYVGCFSLASPWTRLLDIFPKPHTPDQVNTQFYLYTRNARDRYYVTTRPDVSVAGSDFVASRPTIFITHGFASNGNGSWQDGMKDALLDKIDANVFITDWGDGASTWNYLQVASNTRIVGREMARCLSHLIDQLGVKPQTVHLIGHSLGAHISSYAAKDTPGLGRITALDPAQPGFEGYSREVRLDASDALFVDVIHSDGKPTIPFFGFGMIQSYGDVDFYLNGGFLQPGCLVPKNPPKITSLGDLGKIPVEVIKNFIACPHGRAHEVFTASLRCDDCTFWGHPVTLISDVGALVSRGYLNRYIVPSTTDCTVKVCSPLGLDAINYPARGSFTVATTSDDPYYISEPDVDEKMARSLKNFNENKEDISNGRSSLVPGLGNLPIPNILGITRPPLTPVGLGNLPISNIRSGLDKVGVPKVFGIGRK